ncbi:MAG: M3 family oligoendopeptidase [Deltaproteobacteria bacterium]|nr:M3 family oligoendopeptidase [Deltaproteobacteria bacterium]
MSEKLNEKLGSTAVIWNLSDLYSSPRDPAIKEDIDFCQEEATLIRESFAGKLDTLVPAELARLVRRFERIETFIAKVATFAFLNFTTQIKNQEAGGFLQQVKETSSRIARETVFFELEWSKMEQKTADPLLAAGETAHFRHYLENIRRYASHMLSQSEETILIETAPVGRSSWTNLFEKVLGHMQFGPSKRTEEEVLSDLYSQDREVRRMAAEELTEGLKGQLHILTHIFNTVLADKMISDRLRSYPSWINSMNLANELEDATVEVLIGAATSRYDIVRRYYKVKKELLGLDELKDYDRYAPLPHLPSATIGWEECKAMVLSGFRNFSPKMAEIASFFFDRDWIHAPVFDGKRGGAFAHPCVPEVHPYVLVNYTGNIRDVSTVAHELGHGVHQYLAAKQGYFNSNTPLVLAETASVFAELLIFHDQLTALSDVGQRKAFICQKLESIFATVFRQVSMNRFENLIHNTRRDEGELSDSRLSELWMTTQREMFGDSVTLTDNYGIWWSYIPHFLHTPGYVYSYAFGELLVLALYNLYQSEGKEFIPKYLHLLSQGGSLSPYELLRPFGVNLDDPAFWQGGLSVIDQMLKSIE